MQVKIGPTPTGIAWWYLRVSGIVAIVFVLGHLFVMHYANAPSMTTDSFVMMRWTTVFWRGFDWILLFVALTHGIVGMRNVIGDAVASVRARRLSEAVLGAIAAIFLAIAASSLARGATINESGPLSHATWLVNALDALLGALAMLTYAIAFVIILAIVMRMVYRLPLGWWQLHGQWAWALHRVTGVGIFLFLLVHILDLALLPLAPNLYNATVASYANPFLMPMEIALVCAVIYHALNGTRLWILEFFEEQTAHAAVATFAGVLVATLALVLPSVYVLIRRG